MPADLFKIDWISNDDPMLDHSFDIPWGQRFPNDVFRPEDHLTVMSLLRDGCALRCDSNCAGFASVQSLSIWRAYSV